MKVCLCLKIVLICDVSLLPDVFKLVHYGLLSGLGLGAVSSASYIRFLDLHGDSAVLLVKRFSF